MSTTKQLLQALKEDPYTNIQLGGVYPADCLPTHIAARPKVFIVNCQPHTGPGSHWVAFYAMTNGNIEMFDSFAKHPGYYSRHFTRFLADNSVNWNYNLKRLQGGNSNVCGHYCLFYLFHRVRGVEMKEIVNLLDHGNNIDNDSFVKKFIEIIFGYDYH